MCRGWGFNRLGGWSFPKHFVSHCHVGCCFASMQAVCGGERTGCSFFRLLIRSLIRSLRPVVTWPSVSPTRPTMPLSNGNSSIRVSSAIPSNRLPIMSAPRLMLVNELTPPGSSATWIQEPVSTESVSAPTSPRSSWQLSTDSPMAIGRVSDK